MKNSQVYLMSLTLTVERAENYAEIAIAIYCATFFNESSLNKTFL